MGKFLKRACSLDKLKRCKTMFENSRKKAYSQIFEDDDDDEYVEVKLFRSIDSASNSVPLEAQIIGSALDRNKGAKSILSRSGGHDSNLESMKERFAKLLLGEDMSGGSKGVSSALALSNAITNLAASVFGEQWRLEPMSQERKERWRREIDWLLSVTDHIVEFVPSQQVGKDGSNMEIMITQQRKDLHMNIPALRKLDAMLIEYLDNFRDQNEFTYASRDADESEKGNKRKDDKWWLPTVKVPPNGLSELTRNWIQYQKELVNQVLKAAMAINANILHEMEIPENYIECLPKNGRASLGEVLYKSITDDHFDPEEFFSSVDLSTEHKIVDLKDRIEASVVIWRRKMNNKDSKSPWGSAVSIEKREQFEERAETVLLILKHRFPGIPQSTLDISKIQYNKDVGHAVLESYSRVLESLAFTVMSRIEDVLHADSVARDPTLHGKSRRRPSLTDSDTLQGELKLDAKEEVEKLNRMDAGNPMTLLDFMGWQETETKEANLSNSNDGRTIEKIASITKSKKYSHLEKLENSTGSKSPTARP